MNMLIEALNALALMIASAPQRVPRDNQLDLCVPTINDLETLFTNDKPSLKDNLLDYLDEVGARLVGAETRNLLPIASADNPGATAPLSAVKPAGLLGTRFSPLDFRVSFGHAPVEFARMLLERPALEAVELLTADIPSLLTGLEELRRFDDILIRLLAASEVKDQLPGITLAEALALHRTEGNLGVPRSARSLDHGIPPMIPNSIEPSSLGRETGATSPNISRLVLLEDPAHFATQGNDVLARNLGVAWWMIQIAGLDALDKPHNVISLAPGPAEYGRYFGELSAEIRNAHLGGGTVSVSQRESAWSGLVNDMQVRRVSRGADGSLQANAWSGASTGADSFVRVAPNDPVKLVAVALAEGLLLLRYLGSPARIGARAVPASHSPAGWIAPHHLSYALYNLQVGRRMAFMLSAVSHAILDTRGPAIHKPFRDEIAAHPIWSGTTAATKAAAKAIKQAPESQMTMLELHYGDELADWLLKPARGKLRLEQLDHFIATATTSNWSSWNKPSGPVRGNAHRHHLALTYYHQLTGEVLPF